MQKSKPRAHQSEIDILIDEAIDNKKLSHYKEVFEHLIQKYKLEPFYNELRPIKDKYPHIFLNAYEGAIFHGATYDETRVLLLAALFMKYDNSIPSGSFTRTVSVCFNSANIKLDEDMLELKASVIDLIKLACKPKPVRLFPRILHDSRNMFIYDPDNVLLDYHIKNFADVSWNYTPVDYLTKLMYRLDNIYWCTQWGKAKAFIFNYPRLKQELVYNLKLHIN